MHIGCHLRAVNYNQKTKSSCRNMHTAQHAETPNSGLNPRPCTNCASVFKQDLSHSAIWWQSHICCTGQALTTECWNILNSTVPFLDGLAHYPGINSTPHLTVITSMSTVLELWVCIIWDNPSVFGYFVYIDFCEIYIMEIQMRMFLMSFSSACQASMPFFPHSLHKTQRTKVNNSL